ncbi:hypothetical protein A3J19_03995 [Candidatus Daviesbacteria bacterium RIFCSPLOWO2_02_FULL_41_8]|uniref:Uncharacterized protein n=3 Tax=Candidatus Daviesiibacteriota TaxID=1752718 RepID=A0A1F5NLI6_9BACT|nr:MAG: hypothetical protein A2871_03985 [Candidatus Daviesbacteria bacterium RIFCSPHIGHO2_01_FULL_41_23]OGE33871.1 MAG: hypothetical protein A3D83_00495 [Candidatus Daviesbacteria bacterium RIFCSPHIGHO2_02_FULL_41_10]OGE62298.1 MAG: hypothetical protein A2967_02485 [Candidatus Daviesbacteria bacterium RIFCSPLOWO2_01_FULL_41_32]OGE78394.1 MAG: hypothetical protein A3J19_03995 [Candidatus Daviesbacteria bacterium RIFCSPLOWO2_02_FULL_41_8]
MKKTSIEFIQKTVTELENGATDRRSIFYLYTILREEFKENCDSACEFIIDIGDFMAHSQKRKRGDAFDKVNRFATALLSFTKTSDPNIPLILKPLDDLLFTQTQLMGETIKALECIGNINFNKGKLLTRSEALMVSVMENLAGTEFLIEDKDNYVCKFSDVEFDQEGNKCLYVSIESSLAGIQPRTLTPRLILSDGGSIRCLALKTFSS